MNYKDLCLLRSDVPEFTEKRLGELSAWGLLSMLFLAKQTRKFSALMADNAARQKAVFTVFLGRVPRYQVGLWDEGEGRQA